MTKAILTPKNRFVDLLNLSLDTDISHIMDYSSSSSNLFTKHTTTIVKFKVLVSKYMQGDDIWTPFPEILDPPLPAED